MSSTFGNGLGNTISGVSSIDNLKNKTLKKNYSQISSKVQTYNNNNIQIKPLLNQN